jgi:hypothetical protein
MLQICTQSNPARTHAFCESVCKVSPNTSATCTSAPPTHPSNPIRRVRRSFRGEKTLERSHCDIPGSDFDAHTKATSSALALSHVGAIIIASYTKWNSSASSLVIKAPNSHVRVALPLCYYLERKVTFQQSNQKRGWP